MFFVLLFFLVLFGFGIILFSKLRHRLFQHLIKGTNFTESKFNAAMTNKFSEKGLAKCYYERRNFRILIKNEF